MTMIDLEDRILILDGAMGTMIQKFGLTEDDYRGEFFAGCTQYEYLLPRSSPKSHFLELL